MNRVRLSKRRVQVILFNYFAGYLFLYPLLIGVLFRLFAPLGIPNLDRMLENLVYILVFAVTVGAAWPLLKEHLERFRQNRRAIVKSTLTRYVQMWLVMYGMNLAIILITGLSSSQNQDTVVQQLTQSPLQIILVTCLFAPIVEETVFRGAVFTPLRQRGQLSHRRAGQRVSVRSSACVHVAAERQSQRWDLYPRLRHDGAICCARPRKKIRRSSVRC